MEKGKPAFLLCNCERSMEVDTAAVARALGISEPKLHSRLCRDELASFEAAIGAGAVCVACTQEKALFSEIAEEAGKPLPSFFNIRETAGWSQDKGRTAPKMAALAALATRENTPARAMSVESDGLCLVMGNSQQAMEIATLLNRTLSVTLLIDTGEDILLPASLDFPVFKGRVASVTGAFGGFDVVVDDYAALLPSSRRVPEFAMARDGAKSRCAVLFDLTGGTPLFTRHEHRDGYFRPDPGDPAAVMRAAFDASGMVGGFEKPVYVGYDPEICAHSRSQKRGCNKCIDNCPAGAITSAGDIVAIDASICGGCGNCAAHCPTGAVQYEYPLRRDMLASIQLLAGTYREAGGTNPVLLLHDVSHGAELINIMARTGRGLPHNVIPFEMHATSGIGHDTLATAIAAGFTDVVILANPRQMEEYGALREELSLTRSLLEGMKMEAGRFHLIDETDPEAVEAMLWDLKPATPLVPIHFEPVGRKREVARSAIAGLARAAGLSEGTIPLPGSAPYGAVQVDTDGCTLCLSCVSACPADALRDNPDKPQLRFVESACVQCGLCETTCPENVITLEARYNFSPGAMQPVTLYEEEPFECIRCSTPFAARSTIERISAQLAGSHWMFASGERAELLKMCDSCRLEALAEGGKDPFAMVNERRTRTTDDYLEAGRKGLTIDDFLDNGPEKG